MAESISYEIHESERLADPTWKRQLDTRMCFLFVIEVVQH